MWTFLIFYGSIAIVVTVPIALVVNRPITGAISGTIRLLVIATAPVALHPVHMPRPVKSVAKRKSFVSCKTGLYP